MAYTAREGVCKLDIVGVTWWLQSQVVSNIRGLRRPGLVLQASEICLDLAAVDFQFGLMRKDDVLDAGVSGGA